jgi:hypothetical protein
MSEKSLTLRLALFAATVAISAAPLSAQAFYGPVGGTVRNQSSAAVVGATISEVIQQCPKCDPESLVYAVLQNGSQPRNEASTSTLGDL